MYTLHFYNLTLDNFCQVLRPRCIHWIPIKMTIYPLPHRNAFKVSKGAKIRRRYNQVPHLTQDTNGEVTNSQLDTTNESQEVSPFPTDAHKDIANIRQNKNIKDPQKKYRLGTVSKIFYWMA